MVSRFAVAVSVCIAAAGIVCAGCISDCKDDYDSQIRSCKVLYDEPDDVDDLLRCFQQAKDEYQSCIEECTE